MPRSHAAGTLLVLAIAVLAASCVRPGASVPAASVTPPSPLIAATAPTAPATAPALVIATTTPTVTPTPQPAAEIVLPPDVARVRSSGALVALRASDAPPSLTREDAMAAVATEFPWGMGGTWLNEPVTVDGWYGIVTVESGATTDPASRAAWVLDYGNVLGVSGSGAACADDPNCEPPPVYDHNVYVIDAVTRAVTAVGSYAAAAHLDGAPTDVAAGCSMVWRGPRGSALYQMNADGSDVRPFPLDLSFGADVPDWSPDGTRIAFTGSADPPGRGAIWLMAADGGNPARILTSDDERLSYMAPVWLDADTLVVTSQRDSTDANGMSTVERALWVVEADGSGLRQLTQGAPQLWDAVPSPDGHWVAYSLNADTWLVAADGSERRAVTGPPHAEAPVGWLPESSGVIVSHHEGGGWPSFLVVPLDGSPSYPYAALRPGDRQPDWSPDGTRIVVQHGDDIWVLNADDSDGSDRRNVTRDPAQDSVARWLPDGSIVFQSNREGILDTVEQLDSAPAALVLHAASGSQPGGLGRWCRTRIDALGQAWTGATARGVVVSPDTLTLRAGEQPWLDVAAIGTLDSGTVTVYRADVAAARGMDLGGRAIVRPCVDERGDEAGCRILREQLDAGGALANPLALPPGDYLLVVAARVNGADGWSWFVEQGFRVRVE